MLEMADDVYVFGTDEQVDEGIIQFLREQDPDWSDWDDYDGEVGEDEDDDEEQPQLAPPRARQQVPQLPPLPPAQPQPPLQVQATQDPEEQDPDFMSQSNVVVRARVGTAISSVPEPRPKNVETEESTCSICFEPWTNSGCHRLVSIKCGHLFGESCITKWIASQTGQNGKPKCPECNRPAKRNDIRRLWSKAVVTLDTSEKDEAVAKLRKEQEARIRSEADLANSRMAYEMLKIQMTNLQKKHDRQRSLKLKYKSEAKRLKLSNTDEDIKKFNYSLFRTIPIPGVYQPTNTSQYLSYRPHEEMLICSRHVRDSFGISKISMRDFSNNLADIIPIHSKPIRDVQCYRVDPFANESLVLTASMDNYLKITSAKSQQVVLGYDLKAPVWSCCWSTTNPFTVYCASKGKQSMISTFDIRNTSAPVTTFSDPQLLGLSPIHSLTHIAPSLGKREGILCGNLSGAFVYNFESNSIPTSSSQSATTSCSQESVSGEKQVPLHVPGASCYSVSLDDVSMEWMASYKFMGKSFTEHLRGTLEHHDEGDMFLKIKHKVTGGPPVPCLSRTSLFSHHDGSIHLAVGSEGVVNVWSDHPAKTPTSSFATSILSSQDGTQPKLEMMTVRTNTSTLQTRDPVKDIKSVVVGTNEYLVALSDRSIQLYQWSEVKSFNSQLSDDDDDDDDESFSQIQRAISNQGSANGGRSTTGPSSRSQGEGSNSQGSSQQDAIHLD
ncbi:RING finger and WD repeat domain-containing protein 3 [Podila verticillata]|nr:RING finger and WD repeat domain-containing protein 3 [Podila verticillata]